MNQYTGKATTTRSTFGRETSVSTTIQADPAIKRIIILMILSVVNTVPCLIGQGLELTDRIPFRK